MANKILAVLGQPSLGEESLLSYAETFRASRKKAKRKSPPRQGKLFEEPAATSKHNSRPARVTTRENVALRNALKAAQTKTGSSWQSMEAKLFPESRQSYLSRYMNQRIPPIATQERAARTWARLREEFGIVPPQGEWLETSEPHPATEAEPLPAPLAPVPPAPGPPPDDGRLKVTSETFLARLNGLKNPTEMRALRIQTVLKLRDEFKDDRPAMATAAGITTANLTKFIHGAKLGALELEALRRLLGPPDKFPVHAANPIAIPRASTEAATTIDQFVADLGRQALAFILNMSNQNKG